MHFLECTATTLIALDYGFSGHRLIAILRPYAKVFSQGIRVNTHGSILDVLIHRFGNALSLRGYDDFRKDDLLSIALLSSELLKMLAKVLYDALICMLGLSHNLFYPLKIT